MPEIVETDVSPSNGPALNGHSHTLGGSYQPIQIECSTDGWIWTCGDGGLVSLSANGVVSKHPAPGNDYVEGFGIAGDGTLLIRLRAAKTIQRVSSSGVPIGQPYSLPTGFRGPYFADGPDGETWLPSYNKALALAFPQAGKPRRINCHSTFGMACDSVGLMWGIDGGLFAVDRHGEEQRRIYFDERCDARPFFSASGALCFYDETEDDRFRINRFEEDADRLTRYRLPAKYRLLAELRGHGDEMWFCGYIPNEGGFVGRLDPGGAATIRKLSQIDVPTGMAWDNAGRLWLIADGSAAVHAFNV